MMGPAGDKQEAFSQLEKRVAAMEKRLDSWPGSWSQIPCRIERLIIEKLTTEKVEINLETLDISELSGILNIGQSYNSTIIRQAPSPEVLRKSQIRRKPTPDQSTPQIRIKYAASSDDGPPK